MKIKCKENSTNLLKKKFHKKIVSRNFDPKFNSTHQISTFNESKSSQIHIPLNRTKIPFPHYNNKIVLSQKSAKENITVKYASKKNVQVAAIYQFIFGRVFISSDIGLHFIQISTFESTFDANCSLNWQFYPKFHE
jgi:hypothetical protein